ncbi:hypothetical protein NDU88_005800 [Pleurodeles waltl]|uniref:Uncharacterized protein n=1 Tax=Pleurodeles waltl TaxID=8319 RepID=A0AAV7VMA1_PLEWA|nr:hypothetical protein NDU88_005800 [Pleurodeles waltl]
MPSNDPWRNGTKEIGNPDDRIPVSVPGQQTEEAAIAVPWQQTEEDAIAMPGNPDIRVPEEVEKEDAKEEEAEHGGRAEKRPDQPQEEEPKNASPGETPKGREGPEEPERRHVPGGTWLSQSSGTLGKMETTENLYRAGL